MQSFVTWCECKADISRADLGYLLLALSYIPLIVIGLLFLVFLLLTMTMPISINTSFIPIVASLIMTLYILNEEKLLRKNLEDDRSKVKIRTVPKETVERLLLRAMSLVCTFSQFLIVLEELFSPSEQASQQILTVLLVFLSGFVFGAIVEYFLCTVGLPPEEKEQRRLEKEASNMVPQKT
jgi:uncharacterized membrane protein